MYFLNSRPASVPGDVISCQTVSCLANFRQSSCLIRTLDSGFKGGGCEVLQGGVPAVVVVVGQVAGDVVRGEKTFEGG